MLDAVVAEGGRLLAVGSMGGLAGVCLKVDEVVELEGRVVRAEVARDGERRRCIVGGRRSRGRHSLERGHGRARCAGVKLPSGVAVLQAGSASVGESERTTQRLLSVDQLAPLILLLLSAPPARERERAQDGAGSLKGHHPLALLAAARVASPSCVPPLLLLAVISPRSTP